MKNANDEQYLFIPQVIFLKMLIKFTAKIELLQVVAIFGVFGVMRRQEIYDMEVSHIEKGERSLVVNIPKTKTHKFRVFTIVGNEFEATIKKYADLRPTNTSHIFFFFHYINAICTR